MMENYSTKNGFCFGRGRRLEPAIERDYISDGADEPPALFQVERRSLCRRLMDPRREEVVEDNSSDKLRVLEDSKSTGDILEE
ncbi:hypothetical protein Q3G72_005086 [Acer saccharum]|nr:hypothetical protein Q3G72_005086 [Acer saccharum]